ncbi:hypothetical protein KW797_04975, partial [Candidatus Parcubacteria bacterium]|nr:hypothetical protein [Candidatus Parcubacteria bacterium]
IPLRGASIIKIVNRLAFPKMAVQEHESLQRTLPRKVLLLFGAGVAAALLYAAIAPFLFSVFFPKYVEGVPYTQVAAILIALQPFGMFVSALSAQAKKGPLYILSFMNPVVRVAIFAILIPLFGLWGAVWGLVLAKASESLLTAWLFFRR